jgi:hypothetical protein
LLSSPPSLLSFASLRLPSLLLVALPLTGLRRLFLSRRYYKKGAIFELVIIVYKRVWGGSREGPLVVYRYVINHRL